MTINMLIKTRIFFRKLCLALLLLFTLLILVLVNQVIEGIAQSESFVILIVDVILLFIIFVLYCLYPVSLGYLLFYNWIDETTIEVHAKKITKSNTRELKIALQNIEQHVACQPPRVVIRISSPLCNKSMMNSLGYHSINAGHFKSSILKFSYFVRFFGRARKKLRRFDYVWIKTV